MGTARTTRRLSTRSLILNKWCLGDDTLYKAPIALLLVILFLQSTSTQKPVPDETMENGVCQSKDIRNSVDMFSQLSGCRVVEGFVQIVLIDKANDTDYANVSFPELREITGYLLLYRVHGLRSVGKIFPNLAVIRGNTLFFDYALVIFEMLHLQEIGLTSLTDILRGSVYLVKNPMLCFVDTIDWNLIATKGKNEHHIKGNKLQNECPKCPPINQTCPTSTVTGEMLCWNSYHCQKVCPAHCNGSSCSATGECCHPFCSGGCTGRTADDCLACMKVRIGDKCIETCPEKTYEYLNRRCLSEEVCYNLPKPPDATDSLQKKPWKPFRGQCTMECPTGFLEVPIKGDQYNCSPCKGVCKKTCRGGNVDSISAAQRLRSCTSIEGALNIQIRGGGNVVKELEENLNMIEEIDDYLKIVRSFPLISLNFLKNLKVIHGKNLESSKYALVVLDNQNLMELWDWSSRKTDFRISRGRLFFHFNPKLCISQIDKLREVAKLSEYTNHEVASNSNGDKVACNLTELEVFVYKKMPMGALIKWQQFDHYDSRTLLGYVVYSIEAPHGNVTMYDGRDACGGDGWRVDDVSVENFKGHSNNKNQTVWINHILTRLKPFTQYAFYVKTYTIATEKSGAQSKIQYFRTAPGTPSEPRALTAYSNSSFELVINWDPPYNPNGNVTHYLVTGQWARDNDNITEQRNYCEEPIINLSDSNIVHNQKIVVKSKETTLEPQSETCSCPQKSPDGKQREREIAFEDHLQNIIYVKRKPVGERGITKRDVSGVSRDPSNYQYSAQDHKDVIVEDVYEKFSVVVRTTNLVMRKLRHYSRYNIAVRACRELETDESVTPANNCSNEAIVFQRTLPLPSADNIERGYPTWEIFNKSLGGVVLKWPEPAKPNGLVLNYQIEYRRTENENFKPNIECITRKSFVNAGNTYTIRNLTPGNYSLRIRATSLAGFGDYTEYKYFYIEENSSMSTLHILVVFFMATIVIIMMMFFMVLYFRRKYSQVPSRKLIASVNPEYVPTVYEPDDWEVPRTRVTQMNEIGQGSFGMVYEGILKSVDGGTDMPCAIKTVNDQATDRERIEFLNEASVMKAFNTHHVVKLLGVVSQGQPTLVIMELMGRGDLKSYLRSHRPDNTDNPSAQPPTLKQILRMAAEIADGMAYLSAKKFVHRDLAARNCMVAEDLTVKIGDFGMTRDIYETDYYRKGSKGLLPVRWMAPESLKDGVFTSHSDAWSYGVVLYEMATLASQPYQGLSNDQVLRYVIEGGIMERPDKCPDKLYSVMKICWRHKPSSRPSFLELVTLLQDDVGPDFRIVSFYHSEEGLDLRLSLSTEDTPLRVSREIEDFSLSDDEDYKDPHSSTSSKVSNGSTTPNGYVPQSVVQTTKC